MRSESVTIVVVVRTRTIEYVQPNLYRIRECNTYITCTGSWPQEATTISYDTLCKLLSARFFIFV